MARTKVFEAYVDMADRVTFEYGSNGSSILRNHCNHNILKHRP